MTTVLHVFGRMDRGGAEMRSVEMLRHLDRNQIQTIYCTLARDDKPGVLDDEIRSLGGEVIRCPLTRGFGRRFRELLREKHVDAMHGHVQFFCGLLVMYAWLDRVPVRIAHWHTTGKKRDSVRKRLQDGVMRALINRFATHIVAVGQGAMESLWPNSKNDPRCRILRSGIDLCRFKNARTSIEIRSELDFPQDALVLVHVGRFNPVKDQVRLVEIFSLIHKSHLNSRLLLLGGGDAEYRDRVEQKSRELGVENLVRFAGVVEEVADYLPAGDVMVFPSQFEGLPGSVLEAIASGVPVLASDLAGIREIKSEIPDVVLLSTNEPNEVWAAKALELAEQFRSPVQKRRLKDELASSSFNLSACMEGHIEVWTNAPLITSRP